MATRCFANIVHLFRRSLYSKIWVKSIRWKVLPQFSTLRQRRCPMHPPIHTAETLGLQVSHFIPILRIGLGHQGTLCYVAYAVRQTWRHAFRMGSCLSPRLGLRRSGWHWFNPDGQCTMAGSYFAFLSESMKSISFVFDGTASTYAQQPRLRRRCSTELLATLNGCSPLMLSFSSQGTRC